MKKKDKTSYSFLKDKSNPPSEEKKQEDPISLKEKKPVSSTASKEEKHKDKKLKDSPEELKEQLKKTMTSYLYLKAEFENYKKQSLKEKQSLMRYGGEAFIQFFIENILDDLERALSVHEKVQKIEDFKKGLTLIQSKIKQTFVHFGIEELDPVGKPFDSETQEALGREKNLTYSHGHVSKVLKKGYKLYEKIIRPAQVIIAENEPSQKNSSSDNTKNTS